MKTSSRFCASASVLALSVFGVQAPLNAQTVASDPARFITTDRNGIDLVDSSFNFTVNEGSIGQGESTLAMVRSFGAAGWRDGYDVRLIRSTVAGQVQIRINGSTSSNFKKVGGVFVPDNADGSTLTEIGGGDSYVLTTANGDQLSFATFALTPGPAAFTSNICSSSVTTSCFLPMASRKKANGLTVTVGWAMVERCYRSGPQVSCSDDSLPFTNIIRGVRIDRVSNNAGYAMDFTYLSNTFTPGSTTNWYRRSTIAFKNTGTTAPSWPTITYTYPTTTTTTTTDIGGRVWNFTYAGTSDGGSLTAVRRPGASSDNIALTYSPSLSSVTIDGVTRSYSRTVSGTTATTTITDANSGVTTAVADLTRSRVTKITNELTRETNYVYDTSARPTEIVQPEGNKTVFAYDARGNVTSTTYKAKSGSGLADIVIAADYPASCTNVVTCNKPNWTKDAKGNQTDYTYDSTHGGVLTMTAPAPSTGAVRPQTRFSYAATGGVTMLTGVSACQTTASCTGTADETKTTAAYTANLLPSSITAAAGNGSLSATTSYTYDILGNQITVDGPLSGTADTTVMRYDNARQVIGVVGPDPDGGGTRVPLAQRFTYNNDGQVTLVEIGTVTDQTDPAWAAFSSQQQAATTYDTNARAVKSELKAGGTTYAVSQTSYDTLGRVDCVAQRMDPTQWASQSVVCTPQTTSANGPDRVSKTTYDAASQVTKIQTAYGTTDQSDEVQFSYTNNGLRASVSDGEGNPSVVQYDGHDRAWVSYYPTTNHTGVNWTDYEQYSYDANGNVTNVRLRDNSNIGSTFDNLNRRIYLDLSGSGIDQDITYTYDLLGRMTGSSDAIAHIANFAYDALGRATSQTGAYGGTKTMQYDLAGRRTRLTWPDSVYVSYDYDVTGNMTAIRENGATSGAGVLATYSYDNLGRRTSVTRGNGTATSYNYDTVSRLTSLAHDFASTTHDLTLGFTYNPASQIATNSRSNDLFAWGGHYNRDKAETPNGLNQLTAQGSTALGHDGKGNISSIGTTGYAYSQRNLQYAIPGGYAWYDPMARLDYISTNSVTGAATMFDYDGLNISTEYDPSGPVRRRFVFGPGTDEPIVWYEGSGTTDRRWLHADERGSIIAVSNGSGAVTNINSYDEYGVPAAGNAGRFQYTGQAWLPELGMYYYKARIYNPGIGRFMQTDPIGYVAGMNLYGYVSGDPVNLIDPFGMSADDIIIRGRRPTENIVPGRLLLGRGNGGTSVPPRQPGNGGGGTSSSDDDDDDETVVTAPVNCNLHPSDSRCGGPFYPTGQIGFSLYGILFAYTFNQYEDGITIGISKPGPSINAGVSTTPDIDGWSWSASNFGGNLDGTSGLINFTPDFSLSYTASIPWATSTPAPSSSVAKGEFSLNFGKIWARTDSVDRNYYKR